MVLALTLAVLMQTPSRVTLPAEGFLEVPFELNSNKIYVQAKVDRSRALWFILDTGAPTTMIDANAAKRLRLAVTETGTVEGAGPEAAKTGMTKAGMLSIDRLTFALGDLPVIELDTVLAPHEGRHVDGVIGGDFFETCVVEIDYLNSRLRFVSPTGYAYSGSGSKIPLTKKDGHVYADLKLKPKGRDPINLQALVDCGARMPLAVSTPVTNEHRLLETSPTLTAMVGCGIGGPLIQQVGRAEAFTVGDITVEEPYLTYSDDREGIFGAGGIQALLGAGFLSRYNVVFDYPNSAMYLDPGPDAGRSLIFNPSGIWFVAAGKDLKQFEVHSVVDNSPGADSGFEKGDIIVSINGKKTNRMKLEEIRKMLGNDDEYYILVITRGKDTKTLPIRTRRFI